MWHNHFPDLDVLVQPAQPPVEPAQAENADGSVTEVC
jgi:hypothetical protein